MRGRVAILLVCALARAEIDLGADGFGKASFGADGLAPSPFPQPPVGRHVRLNVDIGGDGSRKEAIVACKGDDVETLAREFCERHGLEYELTAPTIVGGLRELLAKAAELEAGDAAQAGQLAGDQGGQPGQVGEVARDVSAPPIILL
ncbi:hypothetical protein T492DRAFT_872094 [Pavlovales sp. CCMP2436]|nr:hypothetical protein T492DRAFT_872094 [Pavlovales sp. CCMP2436]